jgi:eukaryotic-like serine/threonine-protein kinase
MVTVPAEVGVLVLLLLGVGGWLLLGGDDEDPGRGSQASASTTTSAPTSAGTVTIDTDGFIGQDYDDVRALLEGQGLTVTRAEASDALLADLGRALDPDAVTGSDPANTTVPVGSGVTLFVASDGFTPDTGEDGDTTEQPQQTTTNPTTPSESPDPGTEPDTESDTSDESDPATDTGETVTETPQQGETVSEPPPSGPTVDEGQATGGQSTAAAVEDGTV